MLRVTGEVVRSERRSGTSRAGNPYTLRTSRVLVGRADFVDITLSQEQSDFRDGDRIDLAVRYTGEFRGGPQLQVVGDWYAIVGEPHPELAAAGK